MDSDNKNAILRRQVETDLIDFVHRVAPNEKASPAEITALPEIAKVLFEQLAFRG